MEEVRVAALSMPKAIEDRPFGEEIVVYRIFDKKGPIFTMISEEKSILNVRVSSDFFEISDTVSIDSENLDYVLESNTYDNSKLFDSDNRIILFVV